MKDSIYMVVKDALDKMGPSRFTVQDLKRVLDNGGNGQYSLKQIGNALQYLSRNGKAWRTRENRNKYIVWVNYRTQDPRPKRNMNRKQVGFPKVKAKYRERLRDPRWQKKRLETMQGDDWACRDCKDDKSPLEVHHLAYRFGDTDPWDYPEEYLITLCDKCHDIRHEEKLDGKAVKDLIDNLKEKFTVNEIHNMALMLKNYGSFCQNLRDLLRESVEIAYDSMSETSDPQG